MSDASDLLDAAALETERFIEAALKHRKIVPVKTGFCLNCAEKLDDEQFCDPDCRDDYELRHRS